MTRRHPRPLAGVLARGRRPGVVLLLAAALAAGCDEAPAPTRPPRDAALRAVRLSLYLPTNRAGPPRAVIFFFGNDVGFWDAHQRLAAGLAGSGYAVAGFDMRPMLDALPEERPARDRAFARQIVALIQRTRADVGGDQVPLVIAGHSLGAEVALWTAAYARVPGVVGVLAMSPGGRSHLRVAAGDLLMAGDPTGPDSFSVGEAVAAVVRAGGRVAIVRGGHDTMGAVDPALLAAGGPGARRFGVPLAGHSLKQLTLASIVVRRALEWIDDERPGHGRPRPP